MTRSVWKGPFVDGFLLKKADKVREGGRNEVNQDLEPSLHGPASIRRSDLRRLQRPKAHSGFPSPKRWWATNLANSLPNPDLLRSRCADKKSKRK